MTPTLVRSDAKVTGLRVRVFRVPTEGGPESDGTLVWKATVMVYVELDADGKTGIGWTYANHATAALIDEKLRRVLEGSDILRHAETWTKMFAAVRNDGRAGVASTAISACDVALWDLKAKLLGQPVCALLGMVRHAVPVYGSGGFTSYDLQRLRGQLAGWVSSGIPRVKMKVGRDPIADVERVRAAREAIGAQSELFVDANGAYARKQASTLAQSFAERGVSWFEEPVAAWDFEGLAGVRDHAPATMEISAGEYGYDPPHFAELIDRRCVDVLQADATRCGGFTGFLAVDGLCLTKSMPLSTHCAPYLHLHVATATKMLRHAEFFHDHVRIERMFFDGARETVDGALLPDLSRPGIGLELKRQDAERYAA